MLHELKLQSKYFHDVVEGYKNFELRCTIDREFNVGDILIMYEYYDGIKTGYFCKVLVKYVFTDFAFVGLGSVPYAILSFDLLEVGKSIAKRAEK